MMQGFFQQVRGWMQQPRAKRVLMHVGFWVFWIFRTFYDIYSYYGVGPGELLFLLVYTITQVPMTYFHLYFLVPRLLNKKKYVWYALATVALVFGYSYVNYTLLTFIPESLSSEGLTLYIGSLNAQYDIFEGFFTLVITYSIKYAGQVLSTQNRILQLQKDNLALELNALKAQINPHFLFNTLNNIYSLALRKSDLAPEMVLKLSDMMRYVLYECNSGPVPVEREIQFVSNYIELERIRHGTNVNIHYSLHADADQSRIEPLLLIPIVENSFKHGINAQMENAFVNINLDAGKDKLTMDVENSISKNGRLVKSASGIGLENVKKRLELIYPGRHLLKIDATPETYKVNLELKLS